MQNLSPHSIVYSVQFSHSVVSNSLQPHESQLARPSCSSPTPRAHLNPCPLSQWCHPTISSSVVPFSSCPQSFPASGSFQMSQLFASGGQNIGVSFNISPTNEHPGLITFKMDWMDLLAVQGTLKSLLQHHSSKASILLCSAFFIVQLSHSCMTTRKIITLIRWTFVDKVMSLLFNMLSRLVITFLPRSKRRHPLNPPSHLPLHPTALVCHRVPVLDSLHHTHIPTIYLTYGNVYVSIQLSQTIPPSHSHTVTISPFFMSASPLLLCK